MTPAERRRVEYVVMDSRAQYDTDAAMVLEVVGPRRPSDKYLKRMWGGHGAMLVLWSDWDGHQYTTSILVAAIP